MTTQNEAAGWQAGGGARAGAFARPEQLYYTRLWRGGQELTDGQNRVVAEVVQASRYWRHRRLGLKHWAVGYCLRGEVERGF